MRSTRSDRRSGRRRLSLRAGTGALVLAAAVTALGCGGGSETPNRWVAVYGTLAQPAPGTSVVRPAGRATTANRTFSALTNKEDPAYPGAQRFLATGSSPRFPVGDSHLVTVVQDGPRLDVDADGKPLASVVDRQRPYLSGRVGLYSEDAEALYRDLGLGGH